MWCLAINYQTFYKVAQPVHKVVLCHEPRYNILACHFTLLQLYNYFEDSNYVYLVLEMCHNGEMSRYLKDRKMPFSEGEGE